MYSIVYFTSCFFSTPCCLVLFCGKKIKETNFNHKLNIYYRLYPFMFLLTNKVRETKL